MYQKRMRMLLHAKISNLFVSGVFLLAMYPAYANSSPVASAVGSSLVVQQNRRTITGIIVDENGETVIGANILVKGTTNGTITDIDGKFSLNGVAEGATLVVSYVGYEDQLIKVGSQTSFNIKLKVNTELIDEVVVVGYASQKKVNLSGSVSSVKMDDIAEKRPITNLSSGLAGMAAGVSVTSASNKPGDDNGTILVRGQGTLNNSAPLVIIDGVESNINTVAPQDVESMTVLKDAASASIYGSRAANGVILITTKKGKSGKINVDYTGYASLESIGRTLDPVSNYADYMELFNEAYNNAGQPSRFTDATIKAWRDDNGKNPLAYPNTNWVDEVFHTAVATNHNLSVSGGSEKINFYTSFGYNNNPGVIDNSGYERYSFRSNVEAKITKWWTAGVKVGGYFANIDIGQDRIDDVFVYGVASTPGMVLYHDGHFGAMQNPEDDAQANNPLEFLYRETGQKKERNVRTQFNTTITPLKGLSVAGSYSYELTDKDNWEKPQYNDRWNFATNTMVQKDGRKSYIYNYNRKIERMFMDAVVRYDAKFFNNRFDLNAMVGASQEMRRDRSFSAQKDNLLDSSMDVINGATGDATVSGGHDEWSMRSFFGRINLGWDNKYLLELNLRADASSRFSKDNRWGYFPSMSAAWRIDQEAFMENTRGWLDALKLRFSYGKLGNNDLKGNNYAAVPVYGQSNYVLNGNKAVGLGITSISNTGLTWESTAITNVGVDFGVLNNRLNGTVEYFHKKTSDILIDLPAPLVHGTAGIPIQNAAEVVNKGFELTLNWADRVNDFHYNVGANMSFVDNKVTKFKGEEASYNGTTMILEGYGINTQYVLIADRIVQTQEDLDYVQSLVDKNKDYFSKYKRPELGDVLYKDMDGNGILDDPDRVARGHGDTPRLMFNFNLGFEYKGFDFSTVMSGTGNYKVQYQHMRSSGLTYGNQISKEVADNRWHEGVTNAKYPRLMCGDGRNTRASTIWETNKAYFKIRNIQLGYTLPRQWVEAASLSRVRLFCSLENFFTFTNYAGMDPETTKFTYPTMRQASFGVNVSF